MYTEAANASRDAVSNASFVPRYTASVPGSKKLLPRSVVYVLAAGMRAQSERLATLEAA